MRSFIMLRITSEKFCCIDHVLIKHAHVYSKYHVLFHKDKTQYAVTSVIVPAHALTTDLIAYTCGSLKKSI